MDEKEKKQTINQRIKVNTINTDVLSDFLLNPFQRTVILNGGIIHKYEEDIFSDKIVYMKDAILKQVAAVHYPSGKILVMNEFDTLDMQSLKAPFYNIDNMRKTIEDLAICELKKAKVEKLSAIKKRPIFQELYDLHHKGLFQRIVFSIMVGNDYACPFISKIFTSSAEFASKLTLSDMVKIMDGDLSQIHKFVEISIFTKDFIARDIVFDEIKKSARNYCDIGKFSEKEVLYKAYYEATVSSGADTFVATLIDGSSMIVKNKMNCLGKVETMHLIDKFINFQAIYKLEYKNKFIYEKEAILRKV